MWPLLACHATNSGLKGDRSPTGLGKQLGWCDQAGPKGALSPKEMGVPSIDRGT